MLDLLLWLLIAYLIGSIPWGLIIGKLFFNKDIRNYGSGNLGGTNAGRVLGTPIGIIVIILDASKALLCMLLCYKFNSNIVQYVGVAVCIGHCFPIFANFKGGKAVAASYGYLFALALLVTNEWFYTFICPLAVFLITLALRKMVSLASIIGVSSAAIFILNAVDSNLSLLVFALSLLVMYRHKANLERIQNGTEPKIFEKRSK